MLRVKISLAWLGGLWCWGYYMKHKNIFALLHTQMPLVTIIARSLAVMVSRAGFKYVFSNTNTRFQIFQIQIQIRWKFFFKYKYKYEHSNTNTNMLRFYSNTNINIQMQIRFFTLYTNINISPNLSKMRRNLAPGHQYPQCWLNIHWIGLTHWDRVMQTCVGILTNIGSDNGLSPGRRQAIIWSRDISNTGILLMGLIGTNLSETWIQIQIFSLKKIRLTMSSVKYQPFCVSLNVLTNWRRDEMATILQTMLLNTFHEWKH